MKGQTEIITFILLFIISVTLFTSSTIWAKNIFQQNIDIAQISASESFLKELNNNVLNLVKFGGSREINYKLDGTIELVDNKTIEIKTKVSLQLPRNWVNLTSDSFYIQEKLDGNMFRMQLIYPQKDYKIEFFTEGSRLAQPDTVKIERNSTNVSSVPPVIKIKITFT